MVSYLPRNRIAHCRREKQHRRGMTLVELLVVVAMLMILISVLTAAMQPVLSGQELREAARGLNAFIAASVARAAETGRPSGIWIQRSATTNAVFDVFHASVPPVYAGDLAGSRAFTDTPPGTGPMYPVNPPTIRFASGVGSLQTLVKPGDTIRLNYQGPWYTITQVGTNSVNIDQTGKPYLQRYRIPGVPFQIRRQPRKSPISPLQMPSNTVIDLSKSGVGLDTRFASAQTEPVVIMFNPNGSIENVYYHDGTTWGPKTVIGGIHLLIGRPDQVNQSPGNVGPASPPNENLWISINHQTGRVISTENMGGTIDNARQFAIDGSGMGGG